MCPPLMRLGHMPSHAEFPGRDKEAAVSPLFLYLFTYNSLNHSIQSIGQTKPVESSGLFFPLNSRFHGDTRRSSNKTMLGRPT